MEGFYRQKPGGMRKLLAKEKKGLFEARLPFLRERQVSYQDDLLSFVSVGRVERAQITPHWC